MADMHEIDYKIFGDDMQFVEVELDPNEATVAEAGGMMYMDDGIEMETIFGDGSQAADGGFLGALMGAGKRLLTGESLFMTVFLNRRRAEEARRLRRAVSGQDRPDPPRRDRRRAHRAEGFVPRRGEGRQHRHRVPEEARRRPVRRRGVHHAAPAGRRLGVRPRRRHAARADARARRSDPRRHRLHRGLPAVGATTTSSTSARSSRRSSAAKGCSSPRCGGRAASGCSRCRFSRLANRIIAAAPGLGQGGREEGSVLGGLGGLLDGDNS